MEFRNDKQIGPICPIVLIGLCSLFLFPHSSTKEVVKHGTLIVAMPTKVGLVVCGDKREHNEDDGTDSDTSIKVRRLDSSTIYLASGLVHRQLASTVLGTSFPISTFDLCQIVEQWYRSHSMDNLFTAEIRSGATLPSSSLIGNPWHDLTWQLQTQLFWSQDYRSLNQSNSFFEILIIRATSTGFVAKGIVNQNTLNSLNNDVQYGEPTNIDFNKAEPILLGSKELYNALKDKGREGFDDLRANPYLKPFLDRSQPQNEVTPDEALAFERTLIKATSERGPKLSDNIHVSKECDCALLSFAEGFKWISNRDYLYPTDRNHQQVTLQPANR